MIGVRLDSHNHHHSHLKVNYRNSKMKQTRRHSKAQGGRGGGRQAKGEKKRFKLTSSPSQVGH